MLTQVARAEHPDLKLIIFLNFFKLDFSERTERLPSATEFEERASLRALVRFWVREWNQLEVVRR